MMTMHELSDQILERIVGGGRELCEQAAKDEFAAFVTAAQKQIAEIKASIAGKQKETLAALELCAGVGGNGGGEE